MSKEKRTEEFLENQGKAFHLRLITYCDMYMEQKEINKVREENGVLFFEFPEGKYSITFNTLAEKATEELKEYSDELGIEMPEQFKDLA